MFHAVDSTILLNKAHLENSNEAPIIIPPSDGGAAVELHHGVHKNILEHKQGLKDHIQKERAKRLQQLENAQPEHHKKEKKLVVPPVKEENKPKKQPVMVKDKEVLEPIAKKADSIQTSNNVDRLEEVPDPVKISNVKEEDPKIQTNPNQKLARGYSGLPLDQTPALLGAKRGIVECDVDVKYVVSSLLNA